MSYKTDDVLAELYRRYEARAKASNQEALSFNPWLVALVTQADDLAKMKDAIDKLYAIPNIVDINPRGDESKPQRTFITIYDIDYISSEIVQEDGGTLTEAIEKALAEYERLSKLDESK